MPLDIELVTGAGEDSGTYDVEITIPFVYITAYEMAVRKGYTGTLEQYMEYVNEFPQVIEVNTAIHGIMSDLNNGKNAIADALTMQGKPTMGDEPMMDMASRILDLKLAVPGDSSLVYHERENGLYDLWTEMYNNQRGDYPYMYAISFFSSRAVLTGADAYLCSDGFFTTDSGVHSFTGDYGTQKYVIFYFKEPVYSVIADVAITMFNICVFNGTPQIHISSKIFNVIDIYYQEEFVNTSDIVNLINNSRLSRFSCGKMIELKGGYVANNCGAITKIGLPQLNTISGGSVANNCVRINKIDLPALKSLYKSSAISDVGTTYFDRDIYMPALEYSNGGYIVRVDYSQKYLTRVHLGAPVGGSIYLRLSSQAKPYVSLTVENGFKSYLRIEEFTSMTREYLNDIIENLADNNDGETISIVFGETNIAKLTEDDIAVATAKNYSLS